MDPDKKKALEAAGWKFGSVEEFLGKAPMSDDQMRAEFEAWAKREGYNLIRISWPNEKHSKGYCSQYADDKTEAAEHGFLDGYAAGRKAEREWMQLKNWDGLRLGTTGNQEGER